MKAIAHVLEKYFAYYRQLEAAQKSVFETRVENFIFQKEFIPRGALTQVSGEMQTIAAANATQLTFGLPEMHFEHFKTILFYPDEFYSNYSLSYQTGEVHPEGYIVFSWKHLALGNLLPEQSENIGLQVFAKALGIQNNTEGAEFDVLSSYHLQKWKQTADAEFERCRMPGKELYKNKSLNTREDFFPVSVECFFENPELFKKEFLNLYNVLASLLNQHP